MRSPGKENENSKGEVVRLSVRRLSDEERIAIVLDLGSDLTWNAIAEKHSVSKSTIAAVRKKALENKELIDEIRGLRLGKLYAVSDKFLNELDSRGLDEVSTRDVSVVFGILQDKIQKEEGKGTNINIALATMTELGLLK